jgi:hypothetical protein
VRCSASVARSAANRADSEGTVSGCGNREGTPEGKEAAFLLNRSVSPETVAGDAVRSCVVDDLFDAAATAAGADDDDGTASSAQLSNVLHEVLGVVTTADLGGSGGRLRSASGNEDEEAAEGEREGRPVVTLVLVRVSVLVVEGLMPHAAPVESTPARDVGLVYFEAVV